MPKRDIYLLHQQRSSSFPLRSWKIAAIILFSILMESSVRSDSRALTVTTVDRTGAPFSNVLVIVKSLEGNGEIFRALTDSTGSVPDRQVKPGLYRVIATCPYGICETSVQEFLVKNDPIHLKLSLDVSPTHGVGDVAEVGPSKRLSVVITDSQGKPAQNASLLVRDQEAQHERWYKANATGLVTVELPEGSVTFVIWYADSLTSRTLTPAKIDGLKNKGASFTVRLGTL
jgi:hypothetical protein